MVCRRWIIWWWQVVVEVEVVWVGQLWQVVAELVGL
jgi:hypothetical protein